MATSSDEARAMRMTLASSQASLRLSRALAPVVERLLAEQQERGDGPTEAQLEEVRRRHLEYEALDRAQLAQWEFARMPSETLFSILAMYVYRLTLFAAACVVLWRWFSGV